MPDPRAIPPSDSAHSERSPGAPIATEHRRPAIPFSDAPRGTCRWCGEPILHEDGDKKGTPNRRRRWHQPCVDAYDTTDPRELRRRVRRRDGGRCAVCRLDTYGLKRRMKGRGMWTKLRERGFVRRRSLWELDHVVPLIDGGTHDLSNLQTLCVPCHRKKSARENSERAARRAAEAGASEGGLDAAPRRRTPRTRSEDGVDRELDRLLDRVDAANARVEAAMNAALAEPHRLDL